MRCQISAVRALAVSALLPLGASIMGGTPARAQEPVKTINAPKPATVEAVIAPATPTGPTAAMPAPAAEAAKPAPNNHVTVTRYSRLGSPTVSDGSAAAPAVTEAATAVCVAGCRTPPSAAPVQSPAAPMASTNAMVPTSAPHLPAAKPSNDSGVVPKRSNIVRRTAASPARRAATPKAAPQWRTSTRMIGPAFLPPRGRPADG
jgi:hypothetical protein